MLEIPKIRIYSNNVPLSIISYELFLEIVLIELKFWSDLSHFLQYFLVQPIKVEVIVGQISLYKLPESWLQESLYNQ